MKQPSKQTLQILLPIIILALLYAGTYYYVSQHQPPVIDEREITQSAEIIPIPIENVVHIAWLSENILAIDTADHTYTYDLSHNRQTEIEEFDLYHISGIYRGRPVTATWENKLITEPTEIATHIYIRDFYDKSKEIAQIDTSKTVRPKDFTDDKLILIDNYPGSPMKTWMYNDENGSIEPYREAPCYDGIEVNESETAVHTPTKTYTIPTTTPISAVVCSPDNNHIAVQLLNHKAVILK